MTEENRPRNAVMSSRDSFYDDSRSRRGIALIVCNETFVDPKKTPQRCGAVADQRHLQETFTKLGFEVRCFMDLRVNEILTQAERVTQSNLRHYDCLVVAISSHGGTRQVRSKNDYGMENTDFYDEVDTLYGTDAPFDVERLTEIFNEANCPDLAGKPKLFFLQGCRGEELAETVTVRVRENGCGIPCADAPRATTASASDNAGDDDENMDISDPDITDAQVSQPAQTSTATPETCILTDVAEGIQAMDMDYHKGPSYVVSTLPSSLPAPPAPPASHVDDSHQPLVTAPTPVCAREKVVSRKIIISRDYLTMWASPPGYYAFHKTKGSPFITYLCEVLQGTDREEMDLLTMLTQVNKRVATQYKCKSDQDHLHGRHIVPSIEHMLRKKVYFRDKRT